MWDDRLIISMQSRFNHIDFGTKGAGTSALILSTLKKKSLVMIKDP